MFLLIGSLLFLIFAIYFFNFKRTNKQEIGFDPAISVPRNTFHLTSTIFPTKDTFNTQNIKLDYIAEKQIVVIEYKKNTVTYHLDRNLDVQKLIPILLLSK